MIADEFITVMEQALISFIHGGILAFILYVVLYAAACEETYGILRQLAAKAAKERRT